MQKYAALPASMPSGLKKTAG